MKIETKAFCVPPGKKVRLKKWATSVHPFYKSGKHAKTLLAEDVGELSKLQQLLYASNSHAVLLIFQAMDAAGKDGAISHVLERHQSAGLRSVQLQTSQRSGTES